MDCRYFVLTKPSCADVGNDEDNQILYARAATALLLPRTNLEYYAAHGLFEKHLIQWSKQFCGPDLVFLDIGAHTGTYSLCLAPYAKKVYSFEPQRHTFYALCGGVALTGATNVECINAALGSPEQVGTIALNIVSPDGGGSSVHVGEQRVLRTEMVDLRALDSYDISDVGFVKIDAEGNELHILRGATETLRRSGYPKILFESNNPDTDRDLFDHIGTMYSAIVKVGGTSNMFLATA